MKFATVKKWLALLLASCMVMALAACGKTADDTGTTGGDTGDTGDTGSSAAKIAVVFASSGLGDKSFNDALFNCLLYTSPSPRDRTRSRMPSSA